MSQTTSTVDVGGQVLTVGADAGTLIEPGPAGEDAPELTAALKRRGPGTSAADFVDSLSEATSRIEKAKSRFEAVADGKLDIAEASDLYDGAIGLLEQLDRERNHREALELARAMHGLYVLAKRWIELVRSLRIAFRAASKLGDAGKHGVAWAQHELGTLHLVAGDRIAAKRRLSVAQSLRRELNDLDGLAATEHNLGVLCRRIVADGRSPGRSRRLLAAVAALLLLLIGGGIGAALASRDGDPPPIGTIALAVDTDGPGRVTSTPAGIDCPDRCEVELAARTRIQLTPEPDDGARFETWSGVCGGNPGACTLRPRRDRTVTATFSDAGPPPPAQAKLVVDPPTGGRVTSTTPGIDCGDVCSHEFDAGDTITLEPTADSGFRFTGWGGDCSGNTCAPTMTEDHQVSATFTAVRTITVTIAGEGTVQSEPGGIDCTSGPCPAVGFLATDDQVVLTASGGTFVEWDGDCDAFGAETTCRLDLDADHDVTANFTTPTPEAEG